MKHFRCIELFSGNGDITKILKSHGIDCISVDYDSKKNADLCCNVYELSDDFLKQFQFIWLSPDCTTYSIAQHGIHRTTNGVPVSEYAKQCDYNNNNFINRLLKLDIPFIMENPRGYMRHKPFVKNLNRITVYYSTYGMRYQKPTDLFSNVMFFNSYFRLWKKTEGTIPLDYAASSFLDRCKMPSELIEDIVEFVKEIKTDYETN